MEVILRSALLGLSILLLSVAFLAFHLPGDDRRKYPTKLLLFGQKTSGGGRVNKRSRPVLSAPSNTANRIAILLPYIPITPKTDDNDSSSDDAASILPYFPAFCAGAAGAADVADFLIFHTGSLESSSWPLLRSECPPNVIFINLGSNARLAEYLIRVVDERYGAHRRDNEPAAAAAAAEKEEIKDDGAPRMDQKELLNMVASYIEVNPYGLVEYKPALGHIFHEFLTPYSHWGYSDIDILFGDLGRWITPDEWTDYDIVTYTFGDQHRLYLRGQFTFHRNDPTGVNQIWRKCDYLTGMDERFAKLVQGSAGYHVESAEGCYSAAVMDRTDLKVKFAVKAWTDIYTDDAAYSHGVFLSRSFATGRQVLYKADKDRMEKSGKVLARLAPEWFEEVDTVYRNRENEIQRQVGGRERVDLQANLDAKCMYWALAKYQSKLCLKEHDVSSDETLYWIFGTLYKQRYENAILKMPVITAPFFHFQEWKRKYIFSQLSTLYWSSPIQTFILLPDGAVPMIDGKNNREHTVISPLGLSPLKLWNAAEDGDRSQLPKHTYCLVSGIDASKNVRCTKAVSWQNCNQTSIVAPAVGWKVVDMESDVTLVLTLQITAQQASDQRSLQNVIDHLKFSINRWHGQPCVAVIAVHGSSDMAVKILEQKLGGSSQGLLQTCLIAAVHTSVSLNSDPSRKALLNMAIDAVPTRWYLSGMELERGLSISVDTVFFSYRAAAAHSRLRGNVFLLPQFGLVELEAEKDALQALTYSDSAISISDLLNERRKKKIKNLSLLEEPCDIEADDAVRGIDRLGSVDIAWWVETSLFVADSKRRKKDQDVSQCVATVEDLEHEILEFTMGDHGERMLSTLDESPILLTDNLGPQEGIRTSEIARETEPFAGLRCFNGLRLKQLTILGYSFNVLGGAFAASTEVSRKAANSGLDVKRSRCQACYVADEKHESILFKVAKLEIQRAAKTAILWAELKGMKQ
jgi:hypothetical protein